MIIPSTTKTQKSKNRRDVRHNMMHGIYIDLWKHTQICTNNVESRV